MIKAGNMMTKDVITISPSLSIMEAARLLTSKSVSCLIVVEKDNPVAVVSEGDIIKGMLSKKTKVREVMDKSFMVISPNANFSKISKNLREKNVKRFPVVESGKLIGIITETDVIEATRDFTRFHQVVQDIILAIFGTATAFFLFYFSPLRAMIFG